MRPGTSAVVAAAIGASLLVGCAAAPAHRPQEDPADRAAATFKRSFPATRVVAVSPSPVTGIFEVVAGSQLLYWAPKEGVLIVGTLLSSSGEDLSEPVRARAASAAVAATLPTFRKRLDLAVKVGNGPHEVIEISDPDCPYCRAAHEFFEKRSDVTRYVFLYPLDIHPGAAGKASLILSAPPSERERLLREVYAGGLDAETGLPREPSRELSEIAALVGAAGITGTPVFFVDGNLVRGADLARIKALLER